MEPNSPHVSKWMTAVIASALVLLVAFGGVFALRDRLMASAAQQAHQDAAEREALKQKIRALEETLTQLSSATKTSTEAEATLVALSARLDTLEKAREEKPPEPPAEEKKPLLSGGADATIRLKLAALGGKSFNTELADWVKTHPNETTVAETLRPFSAGGIPTEAELTRALSQSLERMQTPQKVEDESAMGKINTHLKGLVSIRKSGTTEVYASLRKNLVDEDLTSLAQQVEHLEDRDRAPLEDWLKQVKDRRAALDALDSLGRETGN